MINIKIVKNASWIIAGRVIQSLLGVVISMLTARYLGPANYGTINYAASLIAFVTPIMQLGFNAVLVQELIAYPDKEGETIGSAVFMTMLSSLLSMAGVVSFAMIANAGENETILVCLLYSLMLLCRSAELVQYWFQAHLLAKYTSIISLTAYICVSAYRIFLLATGKSIYWFALSQSVDYLVVSLLLVFFFIRKSPQKFKVTGSTVKRLLSKSWYYMFSGILVSVSGQTDKIFLTNMINETENGYYAAALTCATLSAFVFTAIIDSFRPVIYENQAVSKEAYEHSLCKLYCISNYLLLLQALFFTVFSSLIVKILYGSAYAYSADILRILIWYTVFSYMGAIRDIWIVGEGKHKFLLLINAIGAVTNVCLNLFLIPRFGAIGAAVSMVFTQFFTNFVLGFIFKPIRQNNIIILRSMNPKHLLELISKSNHQSS